MAPRGSDGGATDGAVEVLDGIGDRAADIDRTEDWAGDGPVDVAADVVTDAPAEPPPDLTADAADGTAPDAGAEVPGDGGLDVATDAPDGAAPDGGADAPADFTPDVAVDVAADAAVDVANDAAPDAPGESLADTAAGCLTSADCPPFEACGAAGTCGLACDASHRCNGGCCSLTRGSVCVSGTEHNACATGGAFCFVCDVVGPPGGHACVSCGDGTNSCLCLSSPDCSPGFTCSGTSSCGKTCI